MELLKNILYKKTIYSINSMNEYSQSVREETLFHSNFLKCYLIFDKVSNKNIK